MFKRLLLFFLPCAIIILGVFLLFTILPIDIYTIELYKSVCYDRIWDAIIKADYKNAKGTIEIFVAGQKLRLEVTFYENCILNQTVIEGFLNTMDWSKKIKENDFDILAIFSNIFKEYEEYIETLKTQYNENIWKNSHRKADAEYNAKKILYDFVISLNIEEEIKEKAKSMSYIENVLNQINFSDYMLTKDFNSKEHNVLKALCYSEILTTIEESKNTLQEKKIFAYNDPNNNIISKSWEDLLHTTIRTAVNIILFKGFTIFLFNIAPFRRGTLFFIEYFYHPLDPRMLNYFMKIIQALVLNHYNIILSDDLVRFVTVIIIYHILGEATAMRLFLESLNYAAWLNNIE